MPAGVTMTKKGLKTVPVQNQTAMLMHASDWLEHVLHFRRVFLLSLYSLCECFFHLLSSFIRLCVCFFFLVSRLFQFISFSYFQITILSATIIFFLMCREAQSPISLSKEREREREKSEREKVRSENNIDYTILENQTGWRWRWREILRIIVVVITKYRKWLIIIFL